MSIVTDFQDVLRADPLDVARAALVIARIEDLGLDVDRHLGTLNRLGEAAAGDLESLGGASPRAAVTALNARLFEHEGFSGNRVQYDDYRNSLFNVVLDRRLGIPITLALVYMEVARRAGLTVDGVAFPGHFLMRVPGGSAEDWPLILDPFAAGVALDELSCRRILRRFIDAPDDAPLDRTLLEPCTPRGLLARILNNLKRTYLNVRSFPQARAASDLLLALDPTLIVERRDRGLLAYHLADYGAALQDLEDYLRLNHWTETAQRDERDQIFEHVKTLKRRLATWN